MTEIRRDLTPPLTLGKNDHAKLTALAEAGLDRNANLAEILLTELDRAKVVDDAKLPEGVVRMGARVTYQTNSGQEQTVTLVYPVDADIAEGRISVMTPIGAALIGLKAGQSITWHDRADKRHKLTIVKVDASVSV
ncbi:nucleoside diphosphate kinase regulator [Devosia sp. XJ19-1]|uniref:Nucleoside diphosphate kinase regulator n=1 Tax=Devosia ureilytica TaxID=2952754 RepID=A0A9Q4FSE4_9HYPH|nr:nucleoside diphosphate kinase regulator [Devosia ureilytica]MCP8885003.1 nucleoside diphosphate kinase regulator [Devosia ureilytica]MCP8888486.1 nucleoside diphosphate kinase regulator [Devosia ureilytica]